MKPFGQIGSWFVGAAQKCANSFVLESYAPGSRMRLGGVVALMLAITSAGAVAPSVGAGVADSGRHDASAVARARTAFLKKMSSHRPVVRSGVAPLTAAEGITAGGSYNWSGYADVEGGAKTVSSITGQWVIPYVECPSGRYQYSDAIIAQWIGIDGFSDGTVEQLGSATQCFEGVTYYYVWYEMFPGGTVEEGTVACINDNVDCPQPGDRISASVTVTPGGNYTLSLTDFTRPQESFSVTASCAPSTCLDSSAEWIVERPAFELPAGFQIVPLVDFFGTEFSNGTLTSGGKTTGIGDFKDGTVFDLAMIDDTDSYFLACVGQSGFGPQLPLTSNPNACPTVTPFKGSFPVTWYSSF